MAGQTGFGQIADAEFSTLLQALSGTSKGRSFLAEYQRRIHPEDTGALLVALDRIEAAIATIRDQLRPERIADELRRIAMTLDVALESADVGPRSEYRTGNSALIRHARAELSTLADSLASRDAAPVIYLEAKPEAKRVDGPGSSVAIGRALLRQAAANNPEAAPDR